MLGHKLLDSRIFKNSYIILNTTLTNFLDDAIVEDTSIKPVYCISAYAVDKAALIFLSSHQNLFYSRQHTTLQF